MSTPNFKTYKSYGNLIKKDGENTIANCTTERTASALVAQANCSKALFEALEKAEARISEGKDSDEDDLLIEINSALAAARELIG